MDTAYHPVLGKQEVQTYVNSIYTMEAPSPKRQTRKWPISLHFLSHLFGIFWMAPIAVLLILNFKNHVIGASVWCPRGNCNAQVFADDAISQASKLDKADHDILGALQFVAKGLEIWFMVIATALVYDVALFLAKRGGGLPIGYLFTHLEFGDIRNLVNPLMWTSPLPHGNLMPRKPSGTWKLYLFAILAAFLTILTNLMGPGTAVLVLPTMRWVDMPHVPNHRFESLAATAPPTVAAISGCNDTQELDSRNYTCTYNQYGSSLENFGTQLSASLAQWEDFYGGLILATTQESSLSFAANLSAQGDLVWISSRQVVRDLSVDYYDLNQIVTGQQANRTQAIEQPHKHGSFNRSLETVLQQEGPSLGLEAYCFIGNVSIKQIEPDKQVRCYSNWTLDDVSYYKKCYRLGTGWGDLNNDANFTLAGTEANATRAEVYLSDKATYYNDSTDFGSGIQKCINSRTDACDWDAVFNAAVGPDLQNSTTNNLVTEYMIPTAGNSRLYCDGVTYNSFPTYSLDTSPSVNQERLTVMNNLPSTTDKNFNHTSLAVHPDWVLAAWSVANNGAVAKTRLIGQQLARVIGSMLSTDWDQIDDEDTNLFLEAEMYEFVFLHLYTMTQSLSLINFDYTNDTSAAPNDPQGLNQAQPLLHKWSTLRVWAYGITGRTAKLGVIVSILGCVCVLTRLFLAIALRIRHEHSTVELFVAALEHQPTNEFDNLDDESKMARVRYIMEDGQGKPKFVSERVYSGLSNHS